MAQVPEGGEQVSPKQSHSYDLRTRSVSKQQKEREYHMAKLDEICEMDSYCNDGKCNKFHSQLPGENRFILSVVFLML